MNPEATDIEFMNSERAGRSVVPVAMPPHQPIDIDRQKCTGCGICIDSCQVDVLAPGSGEPPVPSVLYSGECWYCGCCVMDCPAGAIQMSHPLMNRVKWVEKATLLAKDDGSDT
jgi:ferredoxin